ncbi:deoxypodophyllotoxin synthase-like [Nicotiana tabacum]|uniref:Deoxypodophyllotoxin synthase-like n=1 Tax=Nicotiana tabacum TaxID=4097 RepID=A0AC58U0T5_TOBAC
MSHQTPLRLPLLTLSNHYLKPNTSTNWFSACDEVRRALEEYGCFLAVYDSVSPELNIDIFQAVEELFDLPTESKLRNTSEKPFYGYYGKIPDFPLQESLGINIGDAITAEGVQNFTNLMWPSGNDHFSEIIHDYANIVADLEKMVKRMVIESYGVENCYDFLDKSTTYLLRLIKYRTPKLDESNVGSQVHTDKTFLSILHQNQVNGLEVKTKDGEWMAIDMTPANSFLVMVGEAFSAWSNNRLHCPVHRVIVKENKPRYTLAHFSYINGMIQTPEELVDEKHPKKFQPFDNFELLDFFAKHVNEQMEYTVRAFCGV